MKSNQLFSMILKTLYPLLMGMLGAIIVFGFFNPTTQTSSIASVQVTQLIEKFVAVNANSKAPTSNLKQRAAQYSEALEASLHTVSQEEGVVLVPSEAVIAGAPDYTNKVQNQMKSYLKGLEK